MSASVWPLSSARRLSEKPRAFSRRMPSASRGRPFCRTSCSAAMMRSHLAAGTRGRTCSGRAPLPRVSPARSACAAISSRSGRGADRAARKASGVPSPGGVDLVQPGQPGLHAAQAFLQRLGEAAADRHRLAHRLHRGGEQGRGAGEFLEGEARDLDNHVVDGRLERRRRRRGDVVVQLVQRVADGQLGGDLGDRESRWPSRPVPRSATPAGSSRSPPSGHPPG